MAVVRAIHVRNGDKVKKGQALLDLDPTIVGADLAAAQKALANAELEIARNRAIPMPCRGEACALWRRRARRRRLPIRRDA